MAIGSGPAERPSLRRRLAGTFALLALVTALVQATFVWFFGERVEEQLLDAVARDQLQRSMEIHREQPALAHPNTPDMALYVVPQGDDASEAVLPAWLRVLPRQPGSYETFSEAGTEYHVAVDFERDNWFYLAYDVAEQETRERNSMIILGLSVLAIVALTLLVSGRLARRLTRDLDRLSQAVGDAKHQAGDARAGDIRASDIRAGDARARAPRAGDAQGIGDVRQRTGDVRRPDSFVSLADHSETARLAEALDAYRERLDQALLRERAFSAAASHELRTPLMRAGSSLDLLQAGKLAPRERELAARVQESLDEIAMLTSALLRVARGRTSDAASEVQLDALVASVAAHLSDEARVRRFSIRIQVAAGTHRRLDRSALWIVLVNLMRNAIRHSGGTTVTVGWRDGALDIEDDGAWSGEAWHAPGEEAEERDLGLGLSIVERICEAAGWRLVIDERPGGGTRARLALDSEPTGPAAPGPH